MKSPNKKALNKFKKDHDLPTKGSDLIGPLQLGTSKLKDVDDIEHMIYLTAHAEQDNVLNEVKGKFARSACYPWGLVQLIEIGILKLVDNPLAAALSASVVAAAGVAYSLTKLIPAINIHRLTRASQEKRAAMAEKLVNAHPEHKGYAVCKYAIDAIADFDQQYVENHFDRALGGDSFFEPTEADKIIMEDFGADFVEETNPSKKLVKKFIDYMNECDDAKFTSVL